MPSPYHEGRLLAYPFSIDYRSLLFAVYYIMKATYVTSICVK